MADVAFIRHPHRENLNLTVVNGGENLWYKGDHNEFQKVSANKDVLILADDNALFLSASDPLILE